MSTNETTPAQLQLDEGQASINDQKDNVMTNGADTAPNSTFAMPTMYGDITFTTMDDGQITFNLPDAVPADERGYYTEAATAQTFPLEPCPNGCTLPAGHRLLLWDSTPKERVRTHEHKIGNGIALDCGLDVRAELEIWETNGVLGEWKANIFVDSPGVPKADFFADLTLGDLQALAGLVDWAAGELAELTGCEG